MTPRPPSAPRLLVPTLAALVAAAVLAAAADGPPRTIHVTFTNSTGRVVGFHLNGGKGLDASLAPGKRGGYTVVVDRGTPPAVRIAQAAGAPLSFALEDGGDYEFRQDGAQVRNHYRQAPLTRHRPQDVCGTRQVGKTTRTTGGGQPDGLSLTGDVERRWADRTTLKVSFVGGRREVRELVEHYAKLWGYYANLYFDFGDYADADVRVAFEPKGQWHSVVGRDARSVPRNQPTMVLGVGEGPVDRVEVRRHTLHEFGHAIGFIHEHQSPNAGISWNEKQVIADCKRDQGWSEAETRHNIFEAYKGTQVNASAFDPRSIMLYSFPKEWTTNGVATGWNTELSELDRRHAARLYPWTPHSLIRIHNASGRTVTVKRRWKGTGTWYDKVMDPGDYYDFWHDAGKAGRFADFEVQYDAGGKATTQTLASSPWRPRREGDYPEFGTAAAYAFTTQNGHLVLGRR